MAKKTKEQIISEMTLEITKLELNLTSAENCYKSSEYNLDELKKIISKQNNELQSLRIDKKEMQKKMNEWVLTQISRLEAVKMLWGIMSGAGTHRQKAAFYEQALTVAQNEINELKKGVNINSDDLPF
jgi:predicted  nucleic acid-binding Zn-ribbon protein